MHSPRKYLIEMRFSKFNCQHTFLIFLLRPAATVHHPEEVGLDPAHPVEAVVAVAKLLMGHRIICNSRMVGLVNDEFLFGLLLTDG
nr:hypothetical protein [Phaeodactylibacter xiamenensis]